MHLTVNEFTAIMALDDIIFRSDLEHSLEVHVIFLLNHFFQLELVFLQIQTP